MQHQISSSRSIDSDQRERGLQALNRPSFNRSISPEPAPSYGRHADSPHRSLRESGDSSERMISRILQKSQMHNGYITADDRQILNELGASQDQINAAFRGLGRIRGGGQAISSAGVAGGAAGIGVVAVLATAAAVVATVAAVDSLRSDNGKPLSPAEVKRARSPNFPRATIISSSRNVNSFDILLVKSPGATPSHVGIVLKIGGEAKVLEAMPGGVREVTLENFVSRNNIGSSGVWIASPSEDLKSKLEGKEDKAMTLFTKEYKGRPYNDGMINNGRGRSLQCGEFVSEFIKDLSGKNVAPLRGLPFHEKWQRDKSGVQGMPKLKDGRKIRDKDNFGPKKRGEYDYTSEANGPFITEPPYPRGVAPSDLVARRNYNVKYRVY